MADIYVKLSELKYLKLFHKGAPFAQDDVAKYHGTKKIEYFYVKVAEAEGYALMFGCVTGPDSGAMGLHYVNGNILSRNELDPTHPQIVIYEPQSDGSLRLIGADFVVFADAWDKKNQGPPQLMGQLFHYFESPNRCGLPAFYTLHVWAWKNNPNGAFVNWHPNVSCQNFNVQ